MGIHATLTGYAVSKSLHTTRITQECGMGFMSPNLERRGRLVRFWTGLFFLLVTLLSWLAFDLPWLTLLAGISTFICWFQAFRGWCFFRACRLRSAK